jgi:hypothetical protein
MGRESGVARGPGESENSEGYKRGQGRERERERESNFYSVLLYGSRQAEARHIQSAPETGFLRGWGRLVSSTVCGFCKLSFLSHSPLLRNNMLLLLLLCS